MTKRPPVRALLTEPVLLLGFGFGTGLTPRMPGTVGTLVGIPAFLVLRPLEPVLYIAIATLLFLVGIYICGAAARRLGVHDHAGIVWDEVVGYLFTMLPVVVLAGEPGLPGPEGAWILAGFVLFRAFDIVKPGPIRFIDARIDGGFGIMLDDLVAAAFAAPALAALVLWLE